LVKTLDKALAVLDTIASTEHPMTVAEVTKRVGLSRPTAYRLCQTLIKRGYLSQNEKDGRISPGYSILRLSGTLLDTNRLRIEALPVLAKLAESCGERVNLGILHQHNLLYLAGIEKPGLPIIYSRFGQTTAAYASALGKAILANLDDNGLQEFFSKVPLTSFTTNTITDRQSLTEELVRVRQQRYAVDLEETSIQTFCIAVPIIVDSGPIGAIGATGRSLEELLEHISIVRHAADVIMHCLGRGV
jgi:DNA-binding IclR family transcriptional regulator